MRQCLRLRSALKNNGSAQEGARGWKEVRKVLIRRSGDLPS
jgi:hypothetical protein